MTESRMYQISKHHIAVPPGETIKEQLEIWEVTKAEFLSRMGMTEDEGEALLEGVMALTPDVASRLESALSIDKGFWLRLESCYREDLKEVEEENARMKRKALS